MALVESGGIGLVAVLHVSFSVGRHGCGSLLCGGEVVGVVLWGILA